MTASCSFSGTSSTLPVAASSASASSRCSRSQWAPGADRGHPLVDEGGGVRHDPDHRRPCGQPRLEVGRRDAGGEADDEVALGDVVVDLGEQAAHVLRLDDEHEGVGERGGIGVVEHPHAVLLGAARRRARLRRSVMTSSSAGRPARSSPERRVSPMTPAPKIATIPMVGSMPGRRVALARVPAAGTGPGRLGATAGVLGRRSALRGERPQEEVEVGGALGHPAHEVAVPVLAERHVDAQLVAAVGDPGLLGGPDAVAASGTRRCRACGRGARRAPGRCRSAAGRGWRPSGSRHRP